MMQRIASLLAALLVLGMVLVGCNQEQVQKEAGRYKLQSYQDGVMLAQSQGKGLNGRFINEMRHSFAREKIKLTHDMFAEDRSGNISYQFLINSKPSQTIMLHVFSSPQMLLKKMPSWYGNEQVAETKTTKTEIYTKDNASLVYTSMGKEKGKYSQKVKAIFTNLFDRMNAHF